MCNAAIAFNKKIKKDGKDLLLTFGISGLLMHNDKIMYDKQTNTIGNSSWAKPLLENWPELN
jgi:hypothetical protein